MQGPTWMLSRHASEVTELHIRLAWTKTNNSTTQTNKNRIPQKEEDKDKTSKRDYGLALIGSMLKIPRVHGYEAARRFTGQNIHLFICFIVRGVAFSVIFFF
jgi:hypothetical protein